MAGNTFTAFHCRPRRRHSRNPATHARQQPAQAQGGRDAQRLPSFPHHHSTMSTSQASLPIAEFVTQLSAKQPTPGGGAAAAVGAAIGAAAAQMAAAYTQRKKDVESGAATSAQELIAKLDTSALLASADADAAAYADLQRSWKDAEMTAEEKAKIEATALAVPVGLIECVLQCKAIRAIFFS